MVSSNCVFCDKAKSEIILENQQAKAFFDINPMTKGHILIVPKNITKPGSIFLKKRRFK